jgi:hypothetical protein
LGSLSLVQGDADGAVDAFEEVLEGRRRQGDVFLESITLANSGWARLARGEARPDLFARHLELSLQLGNDDGIGFALEGLAACAAAAGDVERAGILLGAGETVRLRTGLVDQRSNLTYRPFVDRILASDAAADFEAARGRGRGCRDAWPSTWCSIRRSRSRHGPMAPVPPPSALPTSGCGSSSAPP